MYVFLGIHACLCEKLIMTEHLMTKEQLFTHLNDLLLDERLFFGHGVVDAQDEAMMVLMHVLQQSVNQILTTGNEKIDVSTVDKAKSLVYQRLNTLQPMAYIVGEVYFAELLFKTDKRALVPRSPIAELILNNFSPWLDIKKVSRALDLCTGSGCIGIALAKHHEHVYVDISDISNEALDLAKLNVNINELKQRVKIISSDLFSSIKSSYDLIVSNPPYVSETEYQELPTEYKIEPKLGLTSEHDGLKIPVEIMLNAPKHLTDNGFLILEVGYSDELLDDVFENISFKWIDFKNGGSGVCIFTKEELLNYANYFKNFLHPLKNR